MPILTMEENAVALKYKQNKWIKLKVKCFSSPSTPIFVDFFELFHNSVSLPKSPYEAQN